MYMDKISVKFCLSNYFFWFVKIERDIDVLGQHPNLLFGLVFLTFLLLIYHFLLLLLSLAPQPSLILRLLHKIRLNFLEAS